MAGDALKKVTTGQRIKRLPADAWNAFIDATNYVREQSGGHRFDSVREPWKTNTVLMRNDTDVDLDRFEVVAIHSMMTPPTEDVDEFQQHVVFKGMKPSLDNQRIGVTLEAIPRGDMGRVLFNGIGIAKIYQPTGTNLLPNAGSRTNVTQYLQTTNGPGVEILIRESFTASASTSDLRWAVVRLPGVQIPTAAFWLGSHAGTTITSFNVSSPTVLSLGQAKNEGGAFSFASDVLTCLVRDEYEITLTLRYAGNTTSTVDISNSTAVQKFSSGSWNGLTGLNQNYGREHTGTGQAWNDTQSCTYVHQLLINEQIRIAGTKYSLGADILISPQLLVKRLYRF